MDIRRKEREIIDNFDSLSERIGIPKRKKYPKERESVEKGLKEES